MIWLIKILSRLLLRLGLIRTLPLLRHCDGCPRIIDLTKDLDAYDPKRGIYLCEQCRHEERWGDD